MDSELYRFSPRTAAILARAGWSPTRRSGATAKARLLAQGLLNDPAAEFLEQFYGLTVVAPWPLGVNGLGTIWFDLAQVGNLGQDEQGDLERIWQEKGCPVGAFSMNNIFITPQGRMGFVDCDWTVTGMLGQTVRDGLESLCNGSFGRVDYWKLDDEFRPVELVRVVPETASGAADRVV